MKLKKTILLRVVVTAVVLTAFSTAKGQVVDAVPSMEELRKPFSGEDETLFRSPPRIHYPQTWFHFIGGNVSAEGITADLEAIAGAGFSGVQLFHGQFGGPWPGVEPQITSLSPMWDDIVKHAATEAHRLGLRFTMQNCPGWATSGGPWITPENAMRHLAWSRTDITPHENGITLPVPQPSSEEWRDYRDVAVLAFPTPLGDTGEYLTPLTATGNVDKPWKELLSGETGVWLPGGKEDQPVIIEVTFPEAVTVRTLELPSINSMNHPRCYEPGITLSLHAISADGTPQQVMHSVLPAGNSMDNAPDLSLACSGEIASDTYRITLSHKYDMNLRSLRLSSAARKNSWQSEAAWTLRNLERENSDPIQDPRAYISGGDIIDLTDFMDPAGRLDWTPESGQWTVLRIGHVNTGRKNSPAPPEGTGWECNKLSPTGATAQFENYIGRINNGPLAGGLLDGMLLDSWECEAQTWTREMETEFSKLNDYDLRLWLPAVLGYVIDDQPATARFLRDWRATISHLFSENFYGTMASLAKENGLSISYETAAGDVFPADILEYYKYADVPMCEFWQPFTDGFVGSLNFKPVKPTASAARFYEKPRVAAEAFTSFTHTWDEQWDMMKEVANLHVAEGVTHMVFHTYTHNPQKPFLPPGTSFSGAGIGTPFLRGQTWWRHMPVLNDYFARCSFMSERGRPVSDIIWYLGDEMSAKPDQDPNFLKGYKYDYCNPDILLNRLRVENGKLLTPDGIQYSVLWLADNYRMMPETLEKILSLVTEGATIIGDAPHDLATLNGGTTARKRFDEAVKSIWGKSDRAGVRKVGKGRVISGMEITEALAAAGIEPDLKGDVIWSHRRADNADWYFVCPQKGRGFSGPLDFRCTGTVEIWNPVTGKICAADARQSDGMTLVMLDLPQSGSCYVVFRNDGKSAGQYMENKTVRTIEPALPWTLSFPEGWGAPQNIELNNLKPWQDIDLTAEAKAFSGTAVYQTSFEVNETGGGLSFIMDLGQVHMIAAVTVNGRTVETLWAPPYRTDITEFIELGTNSVRIEVTSTWFNRLVYDAALPEEERKTWVVRWPAADSPLRDSGLIGPVFIDVEKTM